MRDRSSNSRTTSPNFKYKTTVAIQPRSNRSAELRKQHQSQRSPVSPSLYSHSLAHLELDDDFDPKQCAWSEYHCGCKPHYQTNDSIASLSRSASLSRIRSRSANNSRTPSRFSSVLSLPSPGNSAKSPRGAKFVYSPKGGSTLSRSESALNARLPDDSPTDWLDGRLNTVPCIDMGRKLPPVKTKYKHPFYEKKKKRISSGNAPRGDNRSIASDVTDSNDNHENNNTNNYRCHRDKDSSNHYQYGTNETSSRDLDKKKGAQRSTGTLFNKKKQAKEEEKDIGEDEDVNVSYVPTCEKIEQQEISCFISPSTSSVSSHETKEGCEVLEQDVHGSPRRGRDVPKTLKLDNRFDFMRNSRSPEKERRASPRTKPISAKQIGSKADSQESSPGKTDDYPYRKDDYPNYDSKYKPNQKDSPKKLGSTSKNDKSWLSEDYITGYGPDKVNPLSINVNNTSDDDKMQDSPKSLASGRGSNPRPSEYRTKAGSEPFEDGDDDDYMNRESSNRNAKPNNQNPHSRNNMHRNDPKDQKSRVTNGTSPSDYEDGPIYQSITSPEKFSPKSNLDGERDRFGSGNRDAAKSASYRKNHALEGETDNDHLDGDPKMKNEKIASRTSQDKLTDNDAEQCSRDDESSIDEPLIIPTKRYPVKFQIRGKKYSQEKSSDNEKGGKVPKNSNKNYDTDELPSTLFKPSSGVDNDNRINDSSLKSEYPNTEITKYQGVEQPNEHANCVEGKDLRDGKSGKNNPGIPVIRSEMNVYLNYVDIADDAENLSDTDTDIIIDRTDDSDSEPENIRCVKDSKTQKDPAGRNEVRKSAIESSKPRNEFEPRHGRNSPHTRGFVKIDVKNDEKKHEVANNRIPENPKVGSRQQNPNDANANQKFRQQVYSPERKKLPAERYTSSYYQKPPKNQNKPISKKGNDITPTKDTEVLADRSDYHHRPFVTEKILIPDSRDHLGAGNRSKPEAETGRNNSNSKNKQNTPSSAHRNSEEDKHPTKNSKGQPSQPNQPDSGKNKKPKAFSDNLFDRKTGKFVPDLDLDPNKVDFEDQFDQSLNVQTDLSHIFDSDEEELGSRIEKEIPTSKVDFDQVRNLFNSRKIYKEAKDATDSYQKRKQQKDFGRISQGLVEKLRQYFDTKEMKARRELQFYRLIHEDLANKHNSMKQWDPLMLSPFDEKFVNQQQYKYWVLDARTKRTCERSLSIGRSPIDLEYLERNRYRKSVRESRNASGYSSLGGSLLNTPSSSVVDLHKPRGRSESRASSRNSTRRTPRGVKNMSHKRQNSEPITVRMDPVDFDEHLLNEYNNLPPAVEDRDYKEYPDRYNTEDQPDDFVDEDLIIKETRSKKSNQKPTQKVSTCNIKPTSGKPLNLSSVNDLEKNRSQDPKKPVASKYEIPYKTKPGNEWNPATYDGPFIEDFAANKQPKHLSDRKYAAREIDKFEKIGDDVKNNRNDVKPARNHERNVSEHSPGTPGTDVGAPPYQLNLSSGNDSTPIFSDSSESPQDETSRLVSYYTPQQYNSVKRHKPKPGKKQPENKTAETKNKVKMPSGDEKQRNEAPVGTQTVIHDPFNEDHATYLKHEQERTFAYHPKSGKTFQLDSPRSMASVSSKDDPAFLIKTVKRTTEERLTHIESADNLNEIEIDDSIREHANRLANFQYNEAQSEKLEKQTSKSKVFKNSGRKYAPNDNRNIAKFKSYDNLTTSTFDEGSDSLQMSQERSKSMDELNWSRRDKRLENEKAEHSQNEDDHVSALHQHNSSSMENLIDKGNGVKVSKYKSQLMNDTNASNQSLNARAPSVSSSIVNNPLNSPARERVIKKGKRASSSGNPWSPNHAINGLTSHSSYSSTHSLSSVANSQSQNNNTYYTTNFGSGRQQETHFQPKEVLAVQNNNSNNNNNKIICSNNNNSSNNNKSSPPKRQARVLFDFIPYTKRELGAKMGEIIDIEQQVDENWVQASLRDQIGLIPLTYIEFIKMNQGPTVGKDFFGSMENGMGRDERDDQKPMHGSNQNLNQGRKSALVRPFQSQGEVLQKYDEPPTPKNSQKNILHSEPSYLKQQNNLQGSPLLTQDPQMTQNRNPVNNNSAKSPLGISNTRLGHVRYNFEAQTEVELDLRAGDIVNIRKQVDENWFDGYIGNRRGIFPIDYVEILSNGRQNGVTKNASSLNGSEKLPAHTTASSNPDSCVPKNTAIPSNNLFQYSSLTQCQTQTNSQKSSLRMEEQQSKKPQEYCRVLYNFEPKQPDELELVENDVILVVRKCSDGWFIGSSTQTGLFGSFPGNYVEELVYQ